MIVVKNPYPHLRPLKPSSQLLLTRIKKSTISSINRERLTKPPLIEACRLKPPGPNHSLALDLTLGPWTVLSWTPEGSPIDRTLPRPPRDLGGAPIDRTRPCHVRPRTPEGSPIDSFRTTRSRLDPGGVSYGTGFPVPSCERPPSRSTPPRKPLERLYTSPPEYLPVFRSLSDMIQSQYRPVHGVFHGPCRRPETMTTTS